MGSLANNNDKGVHFCQYNSCFKLHLLFLLSSIMYFCAIVGMPPWWPWDAGSRVSGLRRYGIFQSLSSISRPPCQTSRRPWRRCPSLLARKILKSTKSGWKNLELISFPVTMFCRLSLLAVFTDLLLHSFQDLLFWENNLLVWYWILCSQWICLGWCPNLVYIGISSLEVNDSGKLCVARWVRISAKFITWLWHTKFNVWSSYTHSRKQETPKLSPSQDFMFLS